MTTGRIPQATMFMSELSEARANYFFFGNIIQEEFPKALRKARSLNSEWSGTITELQNEYRRFNRAEMHPKTFNEFLDRARDAFKALGVSTGSLDATTKFSVVNEFSAVGLQSLTELAGLQGASGKDSYHGFRVHTYKERENNSNIWIRGQYLGGGRFGKVYALTHYSTETKVAMKIVEIEPLYRKITMDFQNEIDILSKVRHERIVSYHGSEQKSNHFYLFMDFMAGGSLHDYIKSKGKLDESLSRKYTRQILEGVYYLHSNEIIHRDIKGSNVLLDSNGNVKLADFGISRSIERITSKTDFVHYVRTPYRMAPEILWGNGYGREVDIWSVGCMVVEMLTGHPPLGHLEPQAAMFHIGNKPFQLKLPEHVSQDAIDFVQAVLIWLPTECPQCEELLHHTFIQPIDSAHWQENNGDRSALVKDLEALEKTEGCDLSDIVKGAVVKPTSLDNRPVSDPVLHDIGSGLRTSWKELGRCLGIREKDLKAIDMKEHDKEERKGISMLNMWKESWGEYATGVVLQEALEEIGRPDLSQKGNENLQQLCAEETNTRETPSITTTTSDDSDEKESLKIQEATSQGAVVEPTSLDNRPVSDTVLHDIGSGLRTSWKRLGRCLGIPEKGLEAIDLRGHDNKRKGILILGMWKETWGEYATGVVLQKALEEIGRPDLSQKAPPSEAPPPEPSGSAMPELETRGQMTINEKVSDPVCKGDISRDPGDSVHSPMAEEQKIKHIVHATMEFEAQHKECVRVLPYLEGDQVVVQFYVFSGESGIPKHLKLAAKECFREMQGELKWSDLYNDAANILKVTPLEYPSGQPNRLNASQVDEISEIISKNLHVLDQHRNVTSVQASFKITGSEQTDKPCITIYVLGKGVIPVGESQFPDKLGCYPVDVVDGFWFRTADLSTPNEAQEQSEVLRLGASIGVQGEKASGTLGAIVEDGGTLYALSCNHVMKHSEEEHTEIIHPGLNDHLNYLKYQLNEYQTLIEANTAPGSLETPFSVENLTKLEDLSKKFKELKSIKENCLNSKCSRIDKDAIKVHEGNLKRVLLNPPRVIGHSVAGFSKNVSWKDKEHFVDAAIAKLTKDEIYHLRKGKRALMIGTTQGISGDCSKGTVNAIMNAEKLCKSGRTTKFTTTHRLVGPGVVTPYFMLKDSERRDPIKIGGKVFFHFRPHDPSCPSCVVSDVPDVSDVSDMRRNQKQKISCTLRKWRMNCLCIDNGTKDIFAKDGDSGAVIFEKQEKQGLSGFGIIFAVHQNSYQSCVIASPLQVALEALSKEIHGNLRLVSNFVVPGRPTITKLEDKVETSFTFTWDRPAYDGGDPNIKYKVEWRKKPVDSNTSAEEVDNIGETSLTVSDLEEGKDYEFKVFAQNAEGSSKPATRSYSVLFEEDVAPQHQAAPPKLVAAAAPGPSELETPGQMTTDEKAKEMQNIVKAVMKFEAQHKECVRVLPYSEDDQVVVQFYVFSGESGIPKHLQEDAKRCFGEMKTKLNIKMKWSDLYNEAGDILKATPLKYPPGEQPERLEASKVDEINKIISDNLDELDKHHNVTSVQASFKITKSVQTDIPCIAIYVLGKGLIPAGDSEFPDTLGSYPVDVVNGFWFRLSDTWKPTGAQEQKEVLHLGSSIGIEGERAAGTLGAIVEDGSTFYALSCDHVMRHVEQKERIIHPAMNDYLNRIKNLLKRYGEHLAVHTDRFKTEELEKLSTELKELTEKFNELKSIKNMICEHIGTEIDFIKPCEDELEKVLLNQPRVIGNYVDGLKKNETWIDDREYYVDAAIAKLTEDEKLRLEKNERVRVIGTGKQISIDCFKEIREATLATIERELCMSGRTSEFTSTKNLIGPGGVSAPHFLFESLNFPGAAVFEDAGIGWFNVKIHDPACPVYEKGQANQSGEIKKENQDNNSRCNCSRMWYKNCLCIVGKSDRHFAELGDSGAVIFEERDDLTGFAILFAAQWNTYHSYALVSPLQVALDALSKKISTAKKDCNLSLVSSFVVPEEPTITKLEDQIERSFTLTWDKPVSKKCPYIRYKVEWRKKTINSDTLAKEVDNIDETNLKVTNLEEGEDYEFKVFARNKYGKVYSEPATRSYSVLLREDEYNKNGQRADMQKLEKEMKKMSLDRADSNNEAATQHEASPVEAAADAAQGKSGASQDQMPSPE